MIRGDIFLVAALRIARVFILFCSLPCMLMAMDSGSGSESSSMPMAENALGVTIADAQDFPCVKTFFQKIFPKASYWQENAQSWFLLPNEQINTVVKELAPLYRQIFIEKLNLDQALALVDGKFSDITIGKKNVFHFSIVEQAIKLKQMLHMTTPVLIKNLDKPEVQNWFIKEPLLLKNLIKCLPDSIFEDKQIKNALCQCINKIRIKKNPVSFKNFSAEDISAKEYLLTELEDIRKGEMEICHSHLNISGYLHGNIDLILGNCTITVSKHRLIAISEYFTSLFKSDELSSMKIEGSEEELSLLVDIIEGEIPTINLFNFTKILAIADRFGIQAIKTACDNFLASYKISELLRFFLIDLKEDSLISIWEYCCIHNLNKTKRKICIHFGDRLNQLQKGDSDILQVIKILDPFHLSETLLYFNRAGFRNKLSDPAFLHWIYDENKALKLDFLLEAIRHFVDDPEHRLDVSNTWFVIPSIPPRV